MKKNDDLRIVEQALLNIDGIISREKQHNAMNFDSMDNNCIQTIAVEESQFQSSTAVQDSREENGNSVNNEKRNLMSSEVLIPAAESSFAGALTDIHGNTVPQVTALESSMKNILLSSDVDNEPLPTFCFLTPLPTDREIGHPKTDSTPTITCLAVAAAPAVEVAVAVTITSSITTSALIIPPISEEEKKAEMIRIKKLKASQIKTDRIRYMKLNNFDMKKEFCILCRGVELEIFSGSLPRTQSRC